jgi:OFA family oxalate/formate antiporter-like MFS transporter
LFGGGIILSGFTKSITWIYISYGIMTGLGMGLVYSCTIANTVKFFPDKRGLVAGLATAGYGFGPVLLAPISQSLIASYGVLHAFKVLGIAYLFLNSFKKHLRVINLKAGSLRQQQPHQLLQAKTSHGHKC